jgi:hypothetical protein
MRKLSTRSLRSGAALAVALLLAACGPSELATPTAPQAEALVTAAFPQAEVRVREVDRDEGTLRAPAEFNGADVIFVMQAGEEVWEIASVEQGGNSYTVEQLGDIADTMAVMRELSDALEAFKEATGQYPLLDDLVGLADIVPDYYPEAGSMADAWGGVLRYRHQGEDYTLTSSGPDTEPATRDDILLITGTFVTSE